MNRIVGATAALLAPFAFLAADARAQAPVEAAIAEWIAAINASPDWNADFRDLTYQPADDRAVLSGLSVRSRSLDIEMGFETITITGYAPRVGNGFRASSIVVDAGAIDAGVIKLAISDVAINDLTVPEIGGGVWDPERPFTSIIKAYAPVVAIELANARIGLLSMVEELEGVTSRISYEDLTIDDWSDGRIASMQAGPLRMESPAPEGLVNMTFGGVEAEGMDLDAMLHVYDPDRYVGGIGDRTWRSALGSAAYRDIVIDGPGATVTVAAVTMADMKVRQPRESFAAFLDQAMVDPDRTEDDAEAGRQAINMLSAFGIGRIGLSELNVDAPGVDRMHLGAFTIADLSIEGLGELSFDDVEGVVQGEGFVKIERFAFGGMVFPPADALLEAIAAEENGEDYDYAKLIPTLGFVEASRFDVQSSDIPRTQLEKLRVDLANYVGPIPTLVGIDMVGMNVAVSTVEDADARRMLEALGYERVNADYALTLAWNEADERITIDGFRLAVDDMGVITGTAELTGLTRSAIEDVETLGAAMGDLNFVGGSLTFEDDSIVTRGLTLQAHRMKVEPEAFREQIAGALPFMITFIGNPDFQKQLAPALQTLMRTPGSLTVTAAPVAPIAMSALAAVVDDAPQTLPNLLGLTVTGVAGPPPEPVSLPQPEPAEPPADDAASTVDPGDDGADDGLGESAGAE